MEQKVSYAEFNDFPLKERKHVEGRGRQSALGPGLVPLEEEKVVPHSIQRQRIAHDAADMYTTEGSFASTTHREQPTSSHWVTSYQAQASGLSESKRPQGKKMVHLTTAKPQHATTLGQFAGFGASGSLRSGKELTDLQLGTTKASLHVPGYTGHVTAQRDSLSRPVQTRTTDKSLVIENYHPVCPGYTGVRR